MEQANVIDDSLLVYEKASSQSVNFSTTYVAFSKGILVECMNQVLFLLDIREVLSHDKYPRVPTFVVCYPKNPSCSLLTVLRRDC